MLLTCENNMLFSRVKIRGFRPKNHLVFYWCLYNKMIIIMIIIMKGAPVTSCGFPGGPQ